MDITRRLQELDPTLVLHNEGDWQNPYDPLKIGYSSFNDAGLETETGEFLYALARILKPKNVLETGTHWGVGASYIGMALKDNKQGHLDTIEFLPEIHRRATERMNLLGLSDFVTCHFGDAAAFQPQTTYQLVLLDTEPQTRFAEFIKFWEVVDPGGYILIHDLHRHMHQIENFEHGFAWPFGPVPGFMKNVVTGRNAKPFHFPTPRGLTGFYKTHPGDYKFV